MLSNMDMDRLESLESGTLVFAIIKAKNGYRTSRHFMIIENTFTEEKRRKATDSIRREFDYSTIEITYKVFKLQ
jgi:hypothetical protein